MIVWSGRHCITARYRALDRYRSLLIPTPCLQTGRGVRYSSAVVVLYSAGVRYSAVGDLYSAVGARYSIAGGLRYTVVRDGFGGPSIVKGHS